MEGVESVPLVLERGLAYGAVWKRMKSHIKMYTIGVMAGVRRIGVPDAPEEHESERAQYSPERVALVREEMLTPLPAEVAHEVVSALDYDPCEWIPAVGGLRPRCQAGRFDSWHNGTVDQCRYPAARGTQNCTQHGGVAVAKKLLQENAVLMMAEMVRIALDPDEKTADKIAALNSGLDRTGGLGRTVAQPEPEVRSALMARLEAAYDQVVAAQKPAELEGPEPSASEHGPRLSGA